MKNIFTAAVIATSILCVADVVAPQKAEARTCVTFGPGALCNSYEYSNRHGQVYQVGYANGHEKFGGQVVCNGRNYVAHQGTKYNMAEGQVRWVVEEFCALPNN